MSVTVKDILAAKREGRRFAMLTAYDYPTARLVAEAEVPVILVGDSVGDNVLGYANTLPVTMDEMLHHARAVARGAPSLLLVGDMPFGAYQRSCEETVMHATAFLKAGMHAVKMEGGGWVAERVAHLTERSIPVMGHLGLTPQSVNAFGGMRVQGKTEESRQRILADAEALQAAGAFAVVLEGIPRDLAATITSTLAIPTIGIGAGPDCDGQVLILHDLLGISPHTRGGMPKFARAYDDIGDRIVAAARAYADDVREGRFPDDAHSYH
ncbi:MAG: 3-methyl-2-oxobutanoate hydroxymethyltransferase [Candidatus Dormibacteraeota bacterium]|nr:3-methyl-2-oxobutanoate hydroxymethyltransferase [Candidatus Dormibacteraeota bacterium]MBV9525789.1 3-methyl-2-oxobutanoate hydroxymethyltransferase [Candidatus Dormibacteraeota bacterium]